jgi:hypothetical protein
MIRKGIPFLWRRYSLENAKEDAVVKGLELNVFYKQTSHIGSRGVDITGGFRDIAGDSKGVDITGLFNLVGGKSNGLDVAGVYNFSGDVKNWLIQYGTLVNIVDNLNDDSFVLQVGLWNRIGNQYCPIINVKGIKNIPRVFNRKKGER